MFASLQALFVGVLVAAIGFYSSAIVTSAVLGSYVGIMCVIFMFVVWAANGFYFPLWAQRVMQGFAAIVVAGGLALSLYQYYINNRADLSIIFFSLAYWVIVISVHVSR